MQICRMIVKGAVLGEGALLILTPEASHHVAHVLRLKAGARLIICNGMGREAAGRIESIKEGRVAVRLEKAAAESLIRETRLPLLLACPLLKADKLEIVFRMATEIGVNGFYIYRSVRCVSHPSESSMRNRLERWQRIIEDAVRLSRRTLMPALQGVFTFEQLLSEIPADAEIYIPYEGEDLPLLSKIMRPSKSGIIFLITGPEGGFEPGEVEMAKKRRAQVCSLGKRILRAETAPIAAISAILTLLGEM
ncbi:MAG TPA: 16S rRNA (uracil(1498)-N(3))-methyltransferase [Candidatus Sumerlaeota bacterium]|nr:16S rRNA (uracil(1498)-N(3))-methyltransferase [Candidatus Sumerlaeota bacterium]